MSSTKYIYCGEIRKIFHSWLSGTMQGVVTVSTISKVE